MALPEQQLELNDIHGELTAGIMADDTDFVEGAYQYVLAAPGLPPVKISDAPTSYSAYEDYANSDDAARLDAAEAQASIFEVSVNGDGGTAIGDWQSQEAVIVFKPASVARHSTLGAIMLQEGLRVGPGQGSDDVIAYKPMEGVVDQRNTVLAALYAQIAARREASPAL